MEVITLKQVYRILSEVCNQLNKNNILYLVYGSVAMNLLKGEEGEVRDIDIIVKESDFDKIKNILPDSFNPIQTEFSIHANSKEYIGKDNKPFDVSFDSYEHYFKNDEINISKSDQVEIEGVLINILPYTTLNMLYSKYSKSELTKFKDLKIDGRNQLFKKIMETFKTLDPVAIHQFGSGRYGYQDEFSDFDLWITFQDDKIKEIVNNRENIFSSIAPILVKSDAPQISPIGGSYTLVLYETDHGLFHVDYYLAPKSGSNIRDDAKYLHGDDSLPRGEWILDKEHKGKWTTEHVYYQILAMSYILNKAIVRGGWNADMAKYLRDLYKDYQEITNKTLPPLPNSDDFEFIKELYKNISRLGNKPQQRAVKKLSEYSKLIERLYV